MMDKKVKLIIVFNHKYNQNLEKLRNIYKNRFSTIQFLVPFYDGEDKDVLPVFESSFYFHGFFSQRFDDIYENGKYDYYVFAGDDLILNPMLNEKNIIEAFKLNGKDAFFNKIIPLSEATFWGYNRFKPAGESFFECGVNYRSELPSKEEAILRNNEYGFKYLPVSNKIKYFKPKAKNIKDVVKAFVNKHFYPIKEIDYPLYCGYSDFFIISKDKLREFSRLCGIFAAMNIFVEIAVPTSLVLSIKHDMMVQDEDIDLEAKTMWIQLPEVAQFEKNCDYTISKMVELWPDNYAYLHPLKLSKWRE